MIRQGKSQSQKVIMFSKDISSLPSPIEAKFQMPIQQQDALYPRVFPDSRVPLKVAIMRKIKSFEQYQLNKMLRNIEWKYGKGLLELMHYNFGIDAAAQECTQERLQKALIKGRAFDNATHTFKEFRITSCTFRDQEYQLKGYFADNPKRFVNINKFYVCLSFQNPQHYAQAIIQAQQTRESFLRSARFNFYIDNMDLQQAPQIPKLVVNNITRFIGIQFLSREYYREINNHFRRTMNEILFTHTVLNDDSVKVEQIAFREKRKVNQYKPKNKIITLFKDGKKFKLTLKSLKTKIEEVESKTIFFKEEIVHLIHHIKGKLQMIYNYPIFDLKDELFVIDRFVADNMLMVGYFLHFIDEHVIQFISELIRSHLITHADGWFKLYQTDKNTYLLSKLRRLFIFIEQNIKTIIKNHIQAEVVRYCQCLNKRLPTAISFRSFSDYHLTFGHTKDNPVSYPPLIAISCNIGVNSFELTIKKQKIEEHLQKNLISIFKKLESINTPQSKALIQIYAIFKDEYGIDIQVPTSNIDLKVSQFQNVKINSFQFDWILKEFDQLNQIISKSANTLQQIEDKLLQISNQINLKEIISDHYPNYRAVKEIVDSIQHFNSLYDRIQTYFLGEGIDYGLYFIDYKPAKDQLKQLIEKKIGNYKALLIKQYQVASTSIEIELQKLISQISKKPQNIYQLVSQREKLDALQATIATYNEANQVYLYQLCQDFKCIMSRNDLQRRWLNLKKIATTFTIRTSKTKEYHQIKKDIVEKITKQKQEIVETLKLFQITLQNIKNTANRELYLDNYSKLQHLNEKYLTIKSQIQDIRYKEQHLFLEAQNFDLFQIIEEDFLTLFIIWQAIFKWETNKAIWYFKEFSEFQIDKPDIIITEMLANIKKVEKTAKAKYIAQLYNLLLDVKRQIELFQDKHLRLLKLLKKEGFNKKHLQKIGIFIQIQISQLTLQLAIDLNFLDMLEEIEAVSNDAWNQFYLEQTLNRVFAQLQQMKYELITYFDKKGNQIPLVNNYSSLDQKLEQIILDLQSVQFNPMKGQFEKRIHELLEKSIYISKSLQNCEIFQKKFVEVHPIFDSTDVVKQLPVQNRLFTKLLRNWVELLKYFKKIVSVYDSCNGQNIAEKMVFMINSIETIKVGLANYLQKKRQGFSRFYLLTDQQLYELFASTNDMKILSMHISKLFHSINDLLFDDEAILAIIGLSNTLALKTKVQYKKQNLQEWLNRLQRSIKETLNYHFQRLFHNQRKWTTLLNYECSQMLLMCYEMEKISQIITMGDLAQIEKKERYFIRQLVDIKKKGHLTIAQSINLGSLLVLALYFSQKLSFLKASNISDPQSFEIKKMMKVVYKDEEIKITSFQTQIGYGFQYLGLVKRLVLTNLTERMQLIYMSAIQYSLGGSAIGPAGTGKSETTKDIARICGKNCIIYNCSQSLTFDIIVRILKGMAVTGLWVCLDEFNRLHYQVLNMISEQLSIIFKYKAMGLKLDVQYDREVINFKPDFHLCITYNPTYLGRQNIPNNVQKQFRIVAMVNCDKKMICKLLFYTKGFKEADILSGKLTKVFEHCQSLWQNVKLYDFGLRTLISVIELSAILYQNQGNGESEVFEAIKILVFPRLSINHRQIIQLYSRNIFSHADALLPQNTIRSYTRQIQNIINVRLGIILLGDIFSNKSTIMKAFEQTYKEYRVEQIYINTLTIEQIYGQTNPTTRIFKDGFLTKKIRDYIVANPKEKLVIYIKGVIFPDWIQNLNSVLDNTRSLSLPSGQILWIPDKVKFIINCSHLDFASPATISRSCVVSYKRKTSKELIRCSEERQNLKARAYDRYEVLIKELKQHLLYEVDERLIIHWINKYMEKSKVTFTIEAFMHALALILEGMLDQSGKRIFDRTMKSYFPFEGQVFDNYWDGKAWKQISQFAINPALRLSHQQVQVGDLIIKNKKYRKMQFIFKSYFINKGGLQDILLLIGRQNIGKSAITSSICSQLDKKLIQFSKINLTRKIENPELHTLIETMLHKKSNKRKGMIHGKELIILLDDIHLPEKNKYQYKNAIELLTLLLAKKGCYNYNSMEFEYLQDLYLIGNNNQARKQLNFSKQFLKFVLPVFVHPYQEHEINEIFAQIIKHSIKNEAEAKIYLENSLKLAQTMAPLLQLSQEHIPNCLRFQFIHFRTVLTNILLWNLKDQTDKAAMITELFVFETARIMLPRIHNAQVHSKMKDLISSKFLGGSNSESAAYFHGFQKTQNGTVIDIQKCHRVSNFSEFMREVEYVCDEYVLCSDHPSSSFVVFPQLCILICRISRGLSLNRGHISIVGLPKCGKKAVVQLSNYLIHGRIYRISDQFQQRAWIEAIRNATKQSFLNKCPSLLLLQHHQLKNTTQKEELNTLIKTSFLSYAYSEADYEQLTYLFQNQLIKTHQAVNKQNTIKLFVNYLHKNLHITLLFNPMLKDFKENLIYYPAIAKYTEFYWIAEWPEEALHMIASQAIVQSQIQPYLSIFPKIHEICKRETQSKTKILHWEGLYLDFLKCFEKMYAERQSALQNKQNLLTKSFNIIKQTELKLEATRDEIKKLQPAILILEKETIKTIKSLNIQKANAESVNEQLVKKEVECSRMIGQANAVKIKLQVTNAKVEEELKKAWENVYLVKQSHIAQIKSLMNPSELIKIVITAIVIILNEGQFEIIRNKSEDGLSFEQNYFETGKRYILSKDSKNITKMLTEYNKEKLTKHKIAVIEQKCLNHPRWNIIEAKSANKAVFYFFLWVQAVVKYFKLFQETIPMREELAKTTHIFEEKNKEVEIVKKQLEIYEKKIKELILTHKDKTQRLTEYTNQIKLYEKMLHRGHEILKEIETEKLKWEQYEQDVTYKFKQNIGNSILSSVLITYLSPHTKQTRNHIMHIIKAMLAEAELPINKDSIFWLMDSEEEIILKEMGIYEDEYILNNLKIIEKTDKISFIIDPEEEGIKYLKGRYKVQGIMFVQKVDYYHQFFRKTLERAIADGSVIFVELDGLSLPALVEQLINPKFRKNESSGNTELVVGEKCLYFNPKFKLYLFTTNVKAELQYSIELISKVTTVNFSITGRQLEEHLIATIIAIQFPEENEELEELNKTNIKDNIELSSIENKLLAIFANMTNCEEILKTEDLLQILSTSNRLYHQIQVRIEESGHKRTALKTRREHFRKKGEKTSKLYFQIQKLASISPYYQYSFSWFTTLFRENINTFTDILSLELCKGLPTDKKIIAPLVIAQSQFSTVPFGKLFNDGTEDNEFVQERYRLNVSKIRLSKIASNIQQANLQNLDRLVKDYPEKFTPIFTANAEDILGAIPDQFSSLEFFDKITLINCFRSDCTLRLLKEWLDINLGTTYKFQPAKLLENTACNKPILILENSNALTSSVEKIYQLFDDFFLETGKSICYINSNHCSLDRVKLLLESGFGNDQWVVLEGFGEHAEATNQLIINLMEEGDYKRKEHFRLWVVVDQQQLKGVRDKLVKMSNKVIFEEEVDIIKKISSFFMAESGKLESLSNSSDLNKKKYMLHELAIFHYLLAEKCKYREKQWSKPVNFSHDDLQLNIKYLYFASPQELRKLYPNIVTNIIYGGKITDQQDIDTISLHIDETIRNMIIDRTVFWQTVWADDQFPKSEQEYEMYLKSVFNKENPPFKSVYEQYGINSFVTNFSKQKQFREVMNFYNRSKLLHSKSDLLPKARVRLQEISRVIERKLSVVNTSFEPHKKNAFYNYLVDEQEDYKAKLQLITRDIKHYLQLDGLFDKQEENWCIEVVNNKVPAVWNISTIHSLQSWIALFLDGLQASFSINYEDWNHQEQVRQSSLARTYPLEYCCHFSTFCAQLFTINGCNADTHSLFWETQKLDLLVSSTGVKVDRWYLWNAVFQSCEVKALREGTIELNYYYLLPRGILTVIDNESARKMANYSEMLVYTNSFEYGDNPSPIARILMPTERNSDQQWLKRMRGHLTLAL